MLNYKTTTTIIAYLIAIAISVVILNKVIDGQLGNKEPLNLVLTIVSLLILVFYFVSYCLKMRDKE